MNVSGPGRPKGTQQLQERAPVKEAGGEARVDRSGGIDKAKLSSTSKLLAEMRTQLAAPEDKGETPKVRELRDSIRAGTYKVDHEKVATTMLQEEV
ncbi:MAG: Anti-sigma-28 factor, FlgM [Pseudomonadota bacterium]|jgi:flagellar biosynthesis anti-sigma factor FlgM